MEFVDVGLERRVVDVGQNSLFFILDLKNLFEIGFENNFEVKNFKIFPLVPLNWSAIELFEELHSCNSGLPASTGQRGIVFLHDGVSTAPYLLQTALELIKLVKGLPVVDEVILKGERLQASEPRLVVDVLDFVLVDNQILQLVQDSEPSHFVPTGDVVLLQIEVPQVLEVVLIDGEL